MIWRRRSPDDRLTDAQRERLLIVSVSGEPEGSALMHAKTRLEYVRVLFESGRIGRDDEVPDAR